MNARLSGSLVLLALAGCGGGGGQTAPVVAPPPPVVVAPPPAPPCFRIYEALIYSGAPDLSLYGMPRMTIVDPGHQEYGVVSTDSKETVVIDWEVSGDTDIDHAISWARQSGYKGPLSLYAMLPKRDYWRAVSPAGSAGYKQWQAENDTVQPFVGDVDAIYPSLYTFYPDQDSWVTYAEANMSEGRRIAPGKKMYPFLWPSYHDSTNAELPADYWLKELRTVRDHADGVVLWGGWDFAHNRALPWDANAGWWKATLQFINETPNICK